jgi:hypothetical protein
MVVPPENRGERFLGLKPTSRTNLEGTETGFLFLYLEMRSLTKIEPQFREGIDISPCCANLPTGSKSINIGKEI